VEEIIGDALGSIFITVEIKKVYLEGDILVIEGKYSHYSEEGKFKVTLDNTTLNLIDMELT